MYNNGHRWVVLVTSGLASMLVFGVIASFGSLFTPILDTFNEDRSTAAIVQSLLMAVTFGSGVVIGYLIKRFGVTPVAFTGAFLIPAGFIVAYFANSVLFLCGFAVLTGFGVNCMELAGMISIGKVFTGRQKALAVAIQSAGTPIAGALYPQLNLVLFMTYGLRGTFLVLAGILSNSIAAAIIFSYASRLPACRISPREQDDTDITKVDNGEVGGLVKQSLSDGSTTDITDDSVDTSTCQDQDMNDGNSSEQNGRTSSHGNTSVGKISKSSTEIQNNTTKLVNGNVKLVNLTSMFFVMFIGTSAIMQATIAGFVTLYQDIMTFKGFSISDSNIFYLCYSVFNICGRLLPAIPYKFPQISIFVLCIFSALCGCLGQVVLLLKSSYISVVVGMSLTGTCDGGVTSAMQGAVIQIISPDKHPIALGLLGTSIGLLATGAGPALGAIRDFTESYDIALMITSGLFLMCMLLFTLCFIKYREKCILCNLSKSCCNL